MARGFAAGHPARHSDHPEHHMHKDTHKGHTNRHEHGAHHDLRERHGRGAYEEGARGAPHEGRGNMGEHEPTGRDAAEARPFLIPDYELLPRDDSGGPEWQPYTQEFGDGGYVTGMKSHLTPRGPGRGDDSLEGDEQRSTVQERNKGRGGAEPDVPPRGSSRRARE